MKRIVILHDMLAYKEMFQAVAPDWEIIVETDENVAKSALDGAEIILGWITGMEEICLKENTVLRWLHIWSAGVDFLPMEELRKRKVWVTSSGGMNRQQLSEVGIGLMIALVRGFRPASVDQMKHQWNKNAANEFGLDQIHGKTVGILGIGKVGTELARLAKAFDMRVLGLARTGGDRAYVDKVYEPKNLNELLSSADFVINVLPLTPATKEIISGEQFEVMKSTAFYINIGRGGTTNTPALIAALNNKEIAGAALDVIAPEPLPAENLLWEMPNVILFPHIGGNGPENNSRVAQIFCENLKEYVSGHKPSHNVVNLKTHY